MKKNLGKRPEEARNIGLVICGEARRRIEELEREAKEAKKRQADSRADKFALAYAALVDKVRALESTIRFALSEDGDDDDLLRAAEDCQAIMNASPPDEIGKLLLDQANAYPRAAAERDANAVAVIEAAGLPAGALARLGVHATLRGSWSVGFWAGRSVTLELHGNGSGGEALDAFYAKLAATATPAETAA